MQEYYISSFGIILVGKGKWKGEMTRRKLDENVYGFPRGVVWRLDGENRTESVRQGSCTITPKYAIVRNSLA